MQCARSCWVRSVHAPLVAVSAAVLAAMLGCGDVPDPPPAAVIQTDPASVCYLDGHATEVKVDGSASRAGLTLVPAASSPAVPVLGFVWGFAGAAHQIVATDPTGDLVVVTTAADRPLHISLTVTNSAGTEATSWSTLPITMPPAVVPCVTGKDCGGGQACATVGDDRICVPGESCQLGSDCPVCFHCDDQLGQCVPAGVGP